MTYRNIIGTLNFYAVLFQKLKYENINHNTSYLVSHLFILAPMNLNEDSENVVVGPKEYDNWEFVAYDKDMIFYYVDPTSILKKEEGLLFKELRDYSEPNEGGKSRVAFFFADCEKPAIREILVGIYKEHV